MSDSAKQQRKPFKVSDFNIDLAAGWMKSTLRSILEASPPSIQSPHPMKSTCTAFPIKPTEGLTFQAQRHHWNPHLAIPVPDPAWHPSLLPFTHTTVCPPPKFCGAFAQHSPVHPPSLHFCRTPPAPVRSTPRELRKSNLLLPGPPPGLNGNPAPNPI